MYLVFTPPYINHVMDSAAIKHPELEDLKKHSIRPEGAIDLRVRQDASWINIAIELGYNNKKGTPSAQRAFNAVKKYVGGDIRNMWNYATDDVNTHEK